MQLQPNATKGSIFCPCLLFIFIIGTLAVILKLNKQIFEHIFKCFLQIADISEWEGLI